MLGRWGWFGGDAFFYSLGRLPRFRRRRLRHSLLAVASGGMLRTAITSATPAAAFPAARPFRGLFGFLDMRCAVLLLPRLGHTEALKVGGVFLFFEEIGDVEKGVALQTKVYKGGLHTGQDASHAAFVNGPGEGIFIFPLVINLSELVVF